MSGSSLAGVLARGGLSVEAVVRSNFFSGVEDKSGVAGVRVGSVGLGADGVSVTGVFSGSAATSTFSSDSLVTGTGAAGFSSSTDFTTASAFVAPV